MQQERVARGGAESVTEAGAPRSAVTQIANLLALVLLLACIAIAPFPYGGVLPGGTLTIELLAFIIAALAFASRPAGVRLGAAAVPVLAIVAIGVLGGVQLLPIRAVSPTSAQIYDETNSLLRLSGARPIPARISIAPTETASTTLLTLAYAALLGSAAILANTRGRRRAILAVLFAAGAGHLLIASAMAGGSERLHGAFVNPNHFAGYLQIPLAFALGIIWSEVLTGPDRVAHIRDRGERLENRLLPFVWRVLLWGVIGAGIALTRSRGGILAAAFTTLIMIIAALLHRRRRRIAAGITTAVLLGILFIAFTTGQASILRFLASDPRDIQTDTRMHLWRASIQAWHMFPTFGSGLGTFREAFRRVQPHDLPGLVEQAHNDFLQLLVTGGWVGAALSVLAFGSMFVALFIGWLRQRHREEGAMTLAGMGALLSLTVHGIVEFNMSIPAIPATLAIMLGLSWAATESGERSHGDRTPDTISHTVTRVSLLALFLFVACSDVAIVQTAKATRKPLMVPILADGSLEPPPGGEIRASEPGIVASILVREGERIARGTLLLQLSNPDLDQRVFASRNESLQLAEEQRRSAAELATQRQERDRLKAIVEADRRLLRAGAITAQQQSADEFNYRQAEQRVREGESQLAGLQSRKRVIDDSARELQRRLALFAIRAPIAGVIYNLPRMAGETIAPGQVLGILADPRHLRVRVRVDAPDLPRIHAGQRLTVTFEGLPNRSWEGKVLLVPPGLRQVGGREVAEVIGELSDDTAALPPNASVNVEIVIGEKASALVIPRGALFREGNQRFVYRPVGGRARRTTISVGLIGPNDVEVISGLGDGDEVILPGAVPLRDGEAVKVAS